MRGGAVESTSRRFQGAAWLSLIGSAAGLALFGGCVDEKLVRAPLFEEPVEAAGGFLGYSAGDDKLTVCGNCHVEKQGDWEGTGHAVAWATLEANPDAQGFCEACHTVGELGNTVEGSTGHAATGEERYRDVQCEACHGPGLEHVTNPTDATVPPAPLQAGIDQSSGCGECHSGVHHPFVQEWEMSRHGEGALALEQRTREGCSSCHGGEAVLVSWGINTEYVEKGQGASIGITCAVCHDPHDATHVGQLRFAVDAREPEQNLCMKCHQKRSIPDEGTSTRGPHSPQGPLLLGEIGTVGWTPPNFAYDVDRIRGSHGSIANERLCATCHVNSYEVTDAESGDHVFSSTGHLFKAIPCLDADGIPTADDSCALSVDERSFQGCVAGDCHGDPDAALSALVVAQGRIADLVAELDALLTQVPADQFSDTDAVFTVAEGARFNLQLGEIESSAVHNPFLTEALLDSSIDAVEEEYGLPLPSDLTLGDGGHHPGS